MSTSEAPSLAETPAAHGRLLGAGWWTGKGTFTQTRDGATESVEVEVTLEVGADGIPRALPALGLVSPWAVYTADEHVLDLSPGATLETGGSLWAFCRREWGGTANEVKVEPLDHDCGPDREEWRYRAAYRFADLLHYDQYDYTAPEAPEVSLEAHDSYTLDGEALVVSGRAHGESHHGRTSVALRFQARLTPGRAPLGERCRLGLR